MIRAGALFLLAAGLSGCFRLNYEFGSEPGKVAKRELWQNYFLWGFVPANKSQNLAGICGSDKVSQLKSYSNPTNVFSSLLSVGLSSSSTLEVVCVRSDSQPAPTKSYSAAPSEPVKESQASGGWSSWWK
ncbi:MAG: hypothetical protein DCC75_07460 [Proteobacteria bacterium]|nr:MAG: hypothetical protein DCC75_07460 [Pseudomonadota bacterium]